MTRTQHNSNRPSVTRWWRLAVILGVIGAVVALAVGTAQGKKPKPSIATAAFGRIGNISDLIDIRQVCGKKPLNVALADGWGGNAWRVITRAEFTDEAKKCPNIKDIFYTDGQAKPQKAISDIQGLVARGVKVLVVFPDAGPSVLPAIRAAYKAGVSVVPYTASPGGKPGKDYVAFVAPNTVDDGKKWAEWLVRVLHGKGNVLMLGGTPGNLQSQAEWEGAKAVFDRYPGIKLLVNGPVDTWWDIARTQQVVAGLLAKFPKIDGIFSDYGGGSVGGIRAFVEANRSLPAWAANDGNEFACTWYKYKKTPLGKNFQIMTVNIRTWLVRVALRKAVAHAEGLKDPEPDIINIPVFEDSTDPKKQPKCDPSLPPDATLSSKLPSAIVKALFK